MRPHPQLNIKITKDYPVERLNTHIPEKLSRSSSSKRSPKKSSFYYIPQRGTSGEREVTNVNCVPGGKKDHKGKCLTKTQTTSLQEGTKHPQQGVDMQHSLCHTELCWPPLGFLSHSCIPLMYSGGGVTPGGKETAATPDRGHNTGFRKREDKQLPRVNV